MRNAVVFISMIMTLAAVCPAIADVPDFVTYSGRLSDGTGWGQSTTLDLTFRVYGSADGDDMLWQKEYPGVAVEDGYFSVLLGDGDDPGTPEEESEYNVTEVFAAHEETWITVCVGDDCALPNGELKPRQQIGSVPYAVRAGRVAIPGPGGIVAGNAALITSTIGHGELGGSFDAEGKTKGAIKCEDEPVGYRSAKRVCELVLSSATAHLCTTHEILVSLQAGSYLPVGVQAWAAAGVKISHYDPQSGLTYQNFDCGGWTLDAKEAHAGTLVSSNGDPSWAPCTTPHPLACCDFIEK